MQDQTTNAAAGRIEEAADTAGTTDPGAVLEFLRDHGLDAGTFVTFGKNLVIAIPFPQQDVHLYKAD